MEICHTTLIWKTWVTLLRCIYEPNFFKICAAVWEKPKMCLTKSGKNRKYRSQQPYLNKLETRPPGASPNQVWMISGQWFYRRFLKNWQKITHNSNKNRGSTPMLTNLVGVHPYKMWIHAEVWEKSTMGYYIVTYSFTLQIYIT